MNLASAAIDITSSTAMATSTETCVARNPDSRSFSS